MKTQELLSLLETHKQKALVFEYAPNLFVGTNYHITEVKHLTIESVDCGVQTDSWKETIIQLWENPEEIGKTEYMSAFKALAILKKVGSLKQFVPDAEVKLEYSNAAFHTAQLYITGYIQKDNNLIIQLTTEKTACKAIEICGTDAAMKAIENQCVPNSGCC